MIYESNSHNRHYQRFEYENRVFCGQCIETKEGRTKPLIISIVDISYSGLGFLCNRRIDIDTILTLNLKYKDKIRKFKVKVMWCSYTISEEQNFRFRCGVHFMEVKRPDVIFLNRIIGSL